MAVALEQSCNVCGGTCTCLDHPALFHSATSLCSEPLCFLLTAARTVNVDSCWRLPCGLPRSWKFFLACSGRIGPTKMLHAVFLLYVSCRCLHTYNTYMTVFYERLLESWATEACPGSLPQRSESQFTCPAIQPWHLSDLWVSGWLNLYDKMRRVYWLVCRWKCKTCKEICSMWHVGCYWCYHILQVLKVALPQWCHPINSWAAWWGTCTGQADAPPIQYKTI